MLRVSLNEIVVRPISLLLASLTNHRLKGKSHYLGRKAGEQFLPEISVIIPTLNEEKYIELPLSSLDRQTFKNFETIIADAKSSDRTIKIAKKHGARIIVLPNAMKKGGVAYQRNEGAKIAKGKILAFTDADTILPMQWLQKIHEEFAKDKNLVALVGPGFPFDAPLAGKLEYGIYNFLRALIARLPKRSKRFSSSSYNLAIRNKFFEQIGGFDVVPINSDGVFGRKLLLLSVGKLKFSLGLPVFISARRMKSMGLMKFNRHYFYVIENIIMSLARTRLLRAIKHRASKNFYDRELLKR